MTGAAPTGFGPERKPGSSSLTVVIPVYNNAATMDQLVRETKAACENVCGQGYEILLVEDGSRDDSWQKICDNSDEHVFGLRLSRNFGQHAALKAGFAHARGDIIIMMDADLEDPPEYVATIYEAIANGSCDICFSRMTTDGVNKNRLTSRMFHRVSQKLDNHFLLSEIGVMRGFTSYVRDAILRYGERRPVYGPLTTSVGFRQGVVDVPLPENKGQQSNYTFAKRARLAIDYVIGYTNIPVHFFMWASVLSFLFSFGYGAIIAIQYLIFGNDLPPGFSLLMVLVLFLFAILFFGIGVMGIYISRILTETLRRPLYLVADATEPGIAQHSRSILGDSDVQRD